MDLNIIGNEYRLAPDLVITYINGKPQLRLPSLHSRIKVDWKVLSVVSAFGGESKETLSSLKSVLSEGLLYSIINKLIESKVLIPVSEHNKSEITKMIKEWSEWGEPTWFMHLESKNSQYKSADDVGAEFAKSAEPAPLAYKCNCKESKIPLPTPTSLDNNCLSDILTLRRTCRNFSDSPITLSDLSNLLFYTGGILFTNSTRFFGRVIKKSAPSPGGRHSIELYPVVNNCDGLESGIYHYCQKHHALNLISKEKDVKPFLNDALYGQDYFLDASVTVFYTSVIDRLKWKYKGSRIYRIMHYETTHYAQNFLLTGTALNLGVFTTGAINESLIESKLKIDGIHEIPLYVSGAGNKMETSPYSRADITLSEHLPEDVKVSLPESLSSVDEQKILG
ncbi:SagB/ThcOx family dehydrogenase [Ornithinibacillus scapharcae]|uniref:SagB/ThcOx family dehydrogenase n=1 Tax=Ornithinibacillus scapharcae TaxID=1147159 RepID=UPI000225B068|nr:SagB/ThcOx family dehydrogenase [Ornithinibacillus scapharcae]